MPPITIVIADQRRARGAACLRLLEPVREVRVVGQARTGPDAIAATRLKPRILLLDLGLSRAKGRSLLPVIRRASPDTKVILLAEDASEALILDALAQGAPGYLETRSLRPFLAKAVRVVVAGEAWVPRRMVTKVVQRLRAHVKQRRGQFAD